MKRTTVIFLLDALAFAGFVLLSASGVILHYLLPPGSGRWRTLLGLNRHGWGDIHFWVAVVFFGVLVVHLALHWRWIVAVVKGQPPAHSGFRLALGIVGLLVILALALAPFAYDVEGVPRR